MHRLDEYYCTKLHTPFITTQIQCVQDKVTSFTTVLQFTLYGTHSLLFFNDGACSSSCTCTQKLLFKINAAKWKSTLFIHNLLKRDEANLYIKWFRECV